MNAQQNITKSDLLAEFRTLTDEQKRYVLQRLADLAAAREQEVAEPCAG